jgi:allantoin racemase
MKIALINPNSTTSMTQKALVSARMVVSEGTTVIASNPSDTPKSIEGHYDEAISVPGLLVEVEYAQQAGCQGLVVACFDDPGLGACREIFDGPVMGICEAAMHVASIIATSFSVVTTLPRSIPIIESLAHHYGMSRFCRRVRAADLPVLALEDEGNDAREKIRDEVSRAVQEDGSEAVILGCAGMADLTAWLTEETGVPVIDGVVAGVKMVEALVGAGLATSKIGAYAPPRAK